MRRILLASLFGLLASPLLELGSSSPALAACPSPLTGKDASGTTQNFGVTVDGSGNCYGNVGIVDGSNAGNKATVTAGNALKVDGSAVTQPISGTLTANQGTSPWVTNVTQFGSNNVVTGTGASGVGIPRVTVSNDSNILASQSGTWTVQQGGAPWSVSQSGAWSFTCSSGCSGGGGGGTTELVNSATQQLGALLPGQNNIPLQTNQAFGLPVAPNPFAASQIWDGQHYLSLVPPNGAATQAQTAIVVRNPDAGNAADVAYVGSGNATENAILKGIYSAATSSIPAGANTIGAVNQAGSPWGVNLTQIAGNSVSTANTGTMKVGVVGNTGNALDANGQNAASPANELLVGAQFNTTPTTVTSGNTSPLQMDSAGNLLVNVKAGGGSGGTSSTFGAAFPGTGTAIGVKNGTNMVNLTADGSSNLNVNCAVGCSASSFADQSAFTFGTTAINTIGGVYSAAPTPLASGTAGAALLTAGRIMEVNNQNGAGQEIGANLPGRNNVGIVTTSQLTLAPPPAFPGAATQLWDGQHYASLTPPNVPATAAQTGLVVSVSPNSTATVAGTVTANAGTGTFTVGGTVTANQGGTWTVQQGGAPWSVSQATAANLNATVVGTGTFAVQATDNVTQFGGTNLSTGTGASGAGIPRVTVANDSNILATQSGTWTVQQGTPPWQVVGNVASLATDSGNPVKTGGVFNTTQPTATNGQRIDSQATARGALIVATGVDTFTATVNGTVTANQGGAPWTVNPGTAANWGIGATGAAVPANAVLVGMSQGGNTTALTGTSGNLNVNLAASAATVTVTGTVTANQGGAPWSANVTQFGGTNLSTGTGAGGAGIPRVTVSNDSNVLVTQSTSPWTVQGDSASGAANAGNPVKVGGVFNTTQPTVTTGQTVDAQATARGALIVATGVDNLTVQQGGAPWSVSQSGTWTVQPGNTANTTPWLFSISQGGNTAAVNASSQLSVNCANCSGSGVSQQDATGFTFGTTNMVPIGGVYSATPAALPNGDAGVALLTQGRILETAHFNSAGQEIGGQLPGRNNTPVQINQAQNLTQYNGTLLPGPTDGNGSLRTASVIYDGQHYADVISGNQAPGPQNGALVVVPSPRLSLQCPFTVGINQTASTQVVTNAGGKSLHICGFGFISASAQNVSLVEGTGATCATGTAGLVGGTSASVAAAANGGMWNMTDRITIPMQKAGDNLCVLQSAAGNVSGTLTYGVF